MSPDKNKTDSNKQLEVVSESLRKDSTKMTSPEAPDRKSSMCQRHLSILSSTQLVADSAQLVQTREKKKVFKTSEMYGVRTFCYNSPGELLGGEALLEMGRIGRSTWIASRHTEMIVITHAEVNALKGPDFTGSLDLKAMKIDLPSM